MQELVTAIRGAGAKNLILLGGVHYASAFTGWLSHKPTDPASNLAASWHVYNFTPCNDATCWNGPISTLAASVPVVATEIGQDDCGDGFIKNVMGFLDQEADELPRVDLGRLGRLLLADRRLPRAIPRAPTDRRSRVTWGHCEDAVFASGRST